ncbi:hypothetical protein D5085_02095 [Ectothiorhodospiraceae bacterium BW-2]|nr:hypothetical protein D5085_02095 [Ectothiorhodospiraceae bacterium BW-2]
MAEELLVRDHLSNEMLQAGRHLVERLDSDGCEVTSAFWLYNDENREWRLIIASPLVGRDGPKKFYLRVLDANKSAASDEIVIHPHHIEARDSGNRLVQSLSRAIHTDASLSGIRFSRSVVPGQFIEDAYIYRSMG